MSKGIRVNLFKNSGLIIINTMITNQDGSVTLEDADLTADTKVEDDAIVESVVDDGAKKNLQSAIAKKKAWREKAIDTTTGKSYKQLYDESLINNKNDNTSPEKKVEGEVTDTTADLRKDVDTLKDERQMRVFQHANNLSPDQVEEVFGYAKGMGIEPKDALEKPFMKKVIAQMSAEDTASNATLTPSRRSPIVVGDKTFKDMTPEERKTNFSKAFQKK